MTSPNEIRIQQIATPHGQVSVTISSSSSSSSSTSPAPSPSRQPLSLLLLHGNSSSSRVFRHILAHPPAGIDRTIAMDYPGHGLSANAGADEAAARAAYTQRGYAECAIAVLRALAVTDVVVLGWSLGGHVAIEMLPLLEASQNQPSEGAARLTCRGIMITGSPPANGADQVARGFDKTDGAEKPAKQAAGEDEEKEGKGKEERFPSAEESWTEEEFETYPYEGHGAPHERWMVDAARRTDGRARRIMFTSFRSGDGVDQRAVLAESAVPCAVVNGGAEPFVNLEYVDAVPYGNLWEGKCHRIPGLGHAPFWEAPEAFDVYLARFVRDCRA